MPPSRRCADLVRHGARAADALRGEGGSAALEFLGAGVVLLVPLVYLVVSLAALQAGALAVEGAARQSARIAATAEDERTDREGVADAVRITLADYGMDDEPEVSIRCAPDPDHCLTRGGRVTVTVAATVPLPLAPAAFGAGPPSLPVQASATQPVSRFRPAVAPGRP